MKDAGRVQILADKNIKYIDKVSSNICDEYKRLCDRLSIPMKDITKVYIDTPKGTLDFISDLGVYDVAKMFVRILNNSAQALVFRAQHTSVHHVEVRNHEDAQVLVTKDGKFIQLADQCDGK